MAVVRQYVFLALERLRIGSKIRVTEKGLPFNSINHAKTFRTRGYLGDDGPLEVKFNGIVYELNRDTGDLQCIGEYRPFEGMKGALWE